MSDSGSKTAPRAFWRCRKCGTPNPWESYLTRCLGCGTARPEKPDPAPSAPAATSKTPRPATLRDRLRRLAALVSYGYAGLMLVALALMRWVGEGWWGVTLLLFMPRWLLLVPVPFLALFSGLLRSRRQWAVQGMAALVVAGPLMGFSFPLPRLGAPAPAGLRLRVMTYNRGQAMLDVPRMIALIERERIDLICFQEGNPANQELDRYLARGWYRDQHRRIASRYPIVGEFDPLPELHLSEERDSGRLTRVRVRAPSGVEFIVATVHMPTLRPAINRFLGRDVRWLSIHMAWWRHELNRVLRLLAETRDTPILLAGDFNMPSDDSTMAALGETFRFAFEDAGWGYGYTRPSRYPWFRIDHILGSPEWTFTRCWVGPDFGSDHLPLLAEAVLSVPRGGRE